ncbi:endolytic transglycosylase MltG, partial [uncultured Duncaniella sp.]
KKDERPLVARLYLNRLNKGMRLQADPTVKFAVGDFKLRRIRGEHLRVSSPYNTYKVEGLPPGPIRVPTASALDDVLNAPHHNYIYMCAKEDFSGYHNFATDYATHQANARRYQKALNQRNIM